MPLPGCSLAHFLYRLQACWGESRTRHYVRVKPNVAAYTSPAAEAAFAASSIFTIHSLWMLMHSM